MNERWWENKTAVFQSRLDITELAGVAQIIVEYFEQNVRSVSSLVSLALHLLHQIGIQNKWIEGFDSMRDAFIYLQKHDIWAINKGGRAGIDKRLGDMKVRVAVPDFIVEQQVKQVRATLGRETGEHKGDKDLAALDEFVMATGKTRDQMVEEIMEEQERQKKEDEIERQRAIEAKKVHDREKSHGEEGSQTDNG